MSNKLEAALGGANSFTDSDGDIYDAIPNGVEGWETVDLTVTYKDTSGGFDSTVSFFKADATKIIALIQEAAK